MSSLKVTSHSGELTPEQIQAFWDAGIYVLENKENQFNFACTVDQLSSMKKILNPPEDSDNEDNDGEDSNSAGTDNVVDDDNTDD